MKAKRWHVLIGTGDNQEDYTCLREPEVGYPASATQVTFTPTNGPYHGQEHRYSSGPFMIVEEEVEQ